jgi:phosphoribosylcarboxyaminoimidazole (NCAIR) mutase
MLPLVGIIMGSRSDWATLSHAADTLGELGIPYRRPKLGDSKSLSPEQVVRRICRV